MSTEIEIEYPVPVTIADSNNDLRYLHAVATRAIAEARALNDQSQRPGARAGNLAALEISLEHWQSIIERIENCDPETETSHEEGNPS